MLNILILSIGSAALDAARAFLLSICDIVYKLLIFCFDVFEDIGGASILSSQKLQTIFNRIGLLLGLFMVFRLTFAFIKYIINPDDMMDKSKGIGNIVNRIIVSVILLGSISYIFSFAYRIQKLIIDDQIIPKIILGKTDTSIEGNHVGSEIASALFFTFFSPSEETNADPNEYGYDLIREEVLDGDFSALRTYINERDTSGNYVYYFAASGLASLILGCAALYISVLFTIQVGIRLFQLAYLQIISPIPIMMYITPKGDEILKKWIKQCTTTFFDFFIRSAIIYFVIFVLDSLIDESGLLLDNNLFMHEGIENAYIVAILIIALLSFAKKVPKLIQEIFPVSGGTAGFDYGLNLKKSINDSGAAGIFGAGIGAVGATASNAIHGVMNTKKEFKEKGKKAGFKALGRAALSIPGGFVGGARAGLRTKDITKSFDAVKTTNDNRERRELRQKAGYSALNAPIDKVLAFAGEKSRAEEMIKTAEFRRDALERSKSMQWQSFADKNPMADLSLLQSMQEFEEHGKKIWKGIDQSGKERSFNWNSTTNQFDATDGGSNVTGNDAAMVNTSATIDKQIKDQNKKIKGLEDAKKKAQS